MGVPGGLQVGLGLQTTVPERLVEALPVTEPERSAVTEGVVVAVPERVSEQDACGDGDRDGDRDCDREMLSLREGDPLQETLPGLGVRTTERDKVDVWDGLREEVPEGPEAEGLGVQLGLPVRVREEGERVVEGLWLLDSVRVGEDVCSVERVLEGLRDREYDGVFVGVPVPDAE